MVFMIDLLSLLPPIIAILLALKFKDVIFSLFISILVGSFIFCHGNLINAIQTTFDIITLKIGANAGILAFLSILGILVTVISKSGSSQAYGDMVTKNIKTKYSAQIATAFLGLLIFIDDYFNCLTVGTVMKTITDKYNISREKLAYIIDSIAAPICILVPISSWGVTIASNMEVAGVENGMNILIATIPLNLYPLLTIIMVFIVCSTDFSFGPMKYYEKLEKKLSTNENGIDYKKKQKNIDVKKKGRTIDLIGPILTLIISTIFFMIYTGYKNSSSMGISIYILDTFGWSSTTTSLICGGFISLIVSFILYIPRKIISLSDFISSIQLGVKSMVPSFLILVMSWAIGGICSEEYLNTGYLISSLLNTNLNFPIYLLQVLFFIISGILSFSTGTSWGTMALILPIAFSVCSNMNNLFLISVFSATLAGSVFGDHISPISDTTILSSTGSGCDHITHVSTQTPYALIVAGCSIIGYIIMGYICVFIQNYIAMILSSFFCSLILLFFILYYLNKKYKYK